jgi:hypothetical protein
LVGLIGAGGGIAAAAAFDAFGAPLDVVIVRAVVAPTCDGGDVSGGRKRGCGEDCDCMATASSGSISSPARLRQQLARDSLRTIEAVPL